ncbi:MAG: hypothetical protein HUJ63_05000 [Enterococcus sp.]|nr:hypothetical protein [Enterococcus sp.]
MFVRPIRRFALLLDDQPSRSEGGVEIRDKGFECRHLDYVVVRVGTEESADFGQGDRVVLAHRGCGRRVTIDGTVYRLVRIDDVIAKVESDGKEVRDMACAKTAKKAACGACKGGAAAKKGKAAGKAGKACK